MAASLRAAIADANDRLEVKLKAVFLDRARDTRNPLHFLEADRPVVLAIHVNLVSPGILGRVAGYVGATHDVGDVFVISRDDHYADRNTYRSERVFPFKAKLLDGTPEILSDFLGTFFTAAFQQDAELVATEPREDIRCTDTALEMVGQLPKQLITCRVAERVVDDLELVEIHVQQRMCLVGILAQPGKARDHLVFEFRTVDQPGQCIMRGLVAELAEKA